MQMKFVVESEEDYNKWINAQKNSSKYINIKIIYNVRSSS
jgi:heme/copper-type cytochrome/quinol oxidase subunit 2